MSSTNTLSASTTTETQAKEPFFLIGSERSGTTLLRLMLDHHPEIACNLESEYLVSQISDSRNWPNMAEYSDWLRSDRVFQHSQFKVNPDFDYVELVNDFLLQKKQRDKALIVGATVHYKFNRIPRIWPNAKYIYLLRDGRDVSRSVMQMGWAGNLWTAADKWLEAEVDWEAMHPSLNPDQWLELTYEDLILDSERELRRICDFLDVQFTQQMFDYAKSSSYGLPDANLVCQWKRKIPDHELQQVETRIADQLVKRGYQLSDLEKIPYHERFDRTLRFRSRLNVFRARVIMFGTWLVIADLLSRRLRMKSWQQKTQAKIDKITNDNLR
jgi:hypothetical protein